MERIEYTTVDRTGWPAGEWDGEPDKVQWPDATTSLPCLAVRNAHSGFWCGYVGVPDGHSMHGVGYEKVDVDVHGGLTFANACKPGDEARGICHKPAPGESDQVWWFGFDCAHCGDFGPKDRAYERDRGYPFTVDPDDRYRTLAYVQAECASLAKQLKAIT